MWDTNISKYIFDVISITYEVYYTYCLSANISMRINEMALLGAENSQLPRRFADGNRTSETAGTAKISL